MSGMGPDLDEEVRRLLEGSFDGRYYLSVNPDVAAAGIDPLLHYCRTGWREGRDPSHAFSTRHYLRLHGDVAAAGVNPLLHYVRQGRFEGRSINRSLDAWRKRLDQALARRAAPPQPEPDRDGWMGEADLLRALEGRVSGSPLVVAVSHDDYARHYGGVQNLISDEQRAAAKLGWRYLHVAPLRHVVTLAPDVPAHRFGVGLRLDAEPVGRTDMEALLSILARLRDVASRTDVVVHHMMGHAPELLLRLCEAAGRAPPVVWAHDFFAACESYTLLRNDVVFCGGPPPDSPACAICHHGEARGGHLRRVRAFFEATRPALLAPSEVALETWRATARHPVSSSAAVPLGRLLLAPSRRRRSAGNEERPLRVAFLGARAFAKGWPAFAELADALRDDARYSFHQLGMADGTALSGHIRHVAVSVGAGNREAMIEAVAEAGIDVAIVWPFWPETFCFVAHEAIAGGAFLLTNDAAGNVTRMMVEGGASDGLVLDGREALIALFASGEIVRRVASSRPLRGALLLGSGSIGWLQGADGGPRRAAQAPEGDRAASHA